jgi:hypothetical protein
VSGDTTNSGIVSIDGAAALLSVGGSYVQTGAGASTLLHGGNLVSAGINVTDGLFGGNGSVTGEVTVSGGVVQVGASPDALIIHGDYTQTGGSMVFEIDPNGAGGYLNSTFVIDVGDIFTISHTEFLFNFMNGADPLAFYNDGFFNLNTFFNLSNGGLFGLRYDLAGIYNNNSFRINQPGLYFAGFDSTNGALLLATNSSVPELSSTFFLLLLGLGVMGFVIRRK